MNVAMITKNAYVSLRSKILVGFLLGVLFSPQSILGQQQESRLRSLQSTALPISVGFCAAPIVKLLCTAGHEFGHSLAYKAFTGEFASMHIGASDSKKKPFLSLGKRFHLHTDSLDGVTSFHNVKKMSKEQEFIITLVGPLSGILSSFLLQGTMQAIISYYENKSILSAGKNAVINIFKPFAAIVNNKALSFESKRTLIVVSAFIMEEAIFDMLYVWRPEAGKAHGDGAKILDYLSDGKKIPQWVSRANSSTGGALRAILVVQAVRALLDVQDQENEMLAQLHRSV